MKTFPGTIEEWPRLAILVCYRLKLEQLFGTFAFVKWDDDPISLIRWNTTSQPDPVKERM